MMKRQIERTVDELGRIVIPVEMRNELDMGAKSLIRIFVEGDRLIIEKAAPTCKLCGAVMDTDNKFSICRSCVADIKAM